MARAVVTCLALRSKGAFPGFSWWSVRSALQARRAAGCEGVWLRRTPGGLYWTLTLWRDEGSLESFIRSGPHREAMRRFSRYSRGGSSVRWEMADHPGAGPAKPDWAGAERALAGPGVKRYGEGHNVRERARTVGASGAAPRGGGAPGPGG